MMASASALAIVFGAWHPGAVAQDQSAVPAKFKSLPKPSPNKATGPEISVLIRSTLVALHQANVTGNYTVLRDLGATSFRAINNPVRLGNVYAKIRESQLDLSPAVLLDPFMTKAPVIDANQVLIIEGYFPTEPLNIVFKMGFRFEFGGWRLLSLSIGAREAVASPAADTKKAVSGQKQTTGKAGKAKPSKQEPIEGQ